MAVCRSAVVPVCWSAELLAAIRPGRFCFFRAAPPAVGRNAPQGETCFFSDSPAGRFFQNGTDSPPPGGKRIRKHPVEVSFRRVAPVGSSKMSGKAPSRRKEGCFFADFLSSADTPCRPVTGFRPRPIHPRWCSFVRPALRHCGRIQLCSHCGIDYTGESSQARLCRHGFRVCF